MNENTPHAETQTDDADSLHRRGHLLIAVDQWLPGREATNYSGEAGSLNTPLGRFWRCRYCGQERTHPHEFIEVCEAERSSILEDGGYTIDDSRTRRALTEQMTLRYGAIGPRYRVESASGRTYDVNLVDGTCSCPDFTKRAPRGGCKHLRRVDLAVRAGCIPRPDGVFNPR